MEQQRAQGSILSRPGSFAIPLPQQNNNFQHIPRNTTQQIQQQVDRQSLEDSLKRSITLVFWYKVCWTSR